MGVKRDWLLRCSDSYADRAVCEISVSAGVVEIAGPDGQAFTLVGQEIREFRDAFDAAIDQCEIDRHVRHKVGDGTKPA
ncbi:hypothetical protein SK854_19145 [Lentzea sp. BCCO 10_0061]|uniref:DUF397 domain-containing protein n=1 Tax=Lentzea sokolovensis TaxID=3095429 RepID=A0ABU4UZV8_9PSEU|nr:hypothetical protein [Lentzea sp. BCCO 10_0061]MDX8144241.1 hypothetical protein [Lentzea sp. BCCO 10_0061]